MKKLSRTAWRSDLLGLADGLDEDLRELHRCRPDGETAGTLDIFTQGLVRVWVDTGFSADEIQQALSTGAKQDCELDSAWEDQQQRRRASTEAGRTGLGKLLNGALILSTGAVLFGLLGLVLNLAAVLGGGPARLISSISAGLIVGGFASAAVLVSIQSIQTASHLKRLKARAVET